MLPAPGRYARRTGAAAAGGAEGTDWECVSERTLQMALNVWHEARENLSEDTLDARRATASLIEELEAVDYYQQRFEAASDPELKAVLAHNRDEEKEHAAMLLEWLRRKDEKLAGELATYLNSKGPITQLEGSD